MSDWLQVSDKASCDSLMSLRAFTPELFGPLQTILTSASASIFSSLTIFSTMRSARGKNMVWASFSSSAEMAYTQRGKKTPTTLIHMKTKCSQGCADVWPYLHYQAHDRPEIIRVLGNDFIQRHPSLESNVLLFSPSVSLRSDCAMCSFITIVSPAASSCTPPHGRKPWRGGSGTPRWGGPSSPQPRIASPPAPLWMTGKLPNCAVLPVQCPVPPLCVLTTVHLSVQNSQCLERVVISGL